MSPWNKVFITGTTGFVGANLVRHFAGEGWEVVANGRSPAPARLLSYAKYVQADIEGPIPFQRAGVAIHAAALASDSAGLSALKKANLDGTRHVFEATRDCPCFVYISSSSVYDSRKALHRENETVERQKLSPYGLSKRMAEDWLLEQDWSGRALYILRPRAVYGPGDRILLPRLAGLVKSGQIIAPGSMAVQSSLTHIDNLCAAVALCAARKDKSVQVFNIADLPSYEMRSVVQDLMSAIHGKTIPFRALPLLPLKWLADISFSLGLASQLTPYALATVSKDCVLDIQCAREALGYQPQRDFWTSLTEIAQWANHSGLERIKRASADLPWLSF